MMKFRQKKFIFGSAKGFTLIELLAVIAVIGLGAGIVLVSFSGARDNARNAKIQGAFQQLSEVAELEHVAELPFSYNRVCEAGTLNITASAAYQEQFIILRDEMMRQNNNVPPICYADSGAYCAESALAGTDEVLCADSQGTARQQAAGSCAAGNINCGP